PGPETCSANEPHTDGRHSTADRGSRSRGMRGTIGRGAVQDWRRRMEARLLRKLQPIGAQLKAVAGPAVSSIGSRTPSRPAPARLTNAVAASYSITGDTCTLHTVSAHF